MNLAKEQPKKIWLVSSGSPHKPHRPVEGPFLRAMLSLDGRRFLVNCQRKILIFRGTVIPHSSQWCFCGRPWQSLRYRDLTENFLEGVNIQLRVSPPSDWRGIPNCLRRSAHSFRSEGPNWRRKGTCHCSSCTIWATEQDGSSEMAKRLGNRMFRGPDPCH